MKLFCALYYVPLYFTAVKSHGPIVSGLDILTVTGFLLPGSIVVSFLTTRLGRFRWAVWLGWAVTSVATGLFLLFDIDTPTATWVTILAIFGLGNGMVLTSVNVAIQAISKAEDCGRAAAMYAFMRSLGMSVGVAVGGTTFQNIMSRKLRELGLPDAIAKNAEAFVERLWYLQEDDPVRIGALQAYVAGFHGVFWVMTGIALAALVVSLCIRRHSMNKPLGSHFTLRGGVAVPVQGEIAAAPTQETKSGHTSMTSSTISMWSSVSLQADNGQLRNEQQVTDQKPRSAKVESFMVGPGGMRVPIDPVLLSLPRQMLRTGGPLPEVPEAVYPATGPVPERKRISTILAPFS